MLENIKLEIKILQNRIRNKTNKPKKSEIIYQDQNGKYVQ